MSGGSGQVGGGLAVADPANYGRGILGTGQVTNRDPWFGRPPATIPAAPLLQPATGSYVNSGLNRFAQSAPFQMPSYTPAQFQAPQLAPYRGPLMGAGSGGQAAPSADIGNPGGGVGEGGGYGSGDGGYGANQGSTGSFSDGVAAVANSNLGDAIATLGPTAGGLLGGPIGAAVAGQAVGPNSNFGIQNALSNMYGTQNVNFNAPFGDENGSYGPGPESATNVSSIGAINGSDAMSDAYGGGIGGFFGGPGVATAGSAGHAAGVGSVGSGSAGEAAGAAAGAAAAAEAANTSGYGGSYGDPGTSGDGSGGSGGGK